MNGQEIENKEVEAQEQPKIRKRKLLTDPEKLWVECKTCQEAGNLDNMIRHKLPVKKWIGSDFIWGMGLCLLLLGELQSTIYS